MNYKVSVLILFMLIFELLVSHDQLIVLLRLNEEEAIDIKDDLETDAMIKQGILKIVQGRIAINYDFKSNKRKRK